MIKPVEIVDAVFPNSQGVPILGSYIHPSVEQSVAAGIAMVDFSAEKIDKSALLPVSNALPLLEYLSMLEMRLMEESEAELQNGIIPDANDKARLNHITDLIDQMGANVLVQDAVRKEQERRAFRAA